MKDVDIPSEFVCWSTFLSVLKSRCEWLKEYAERIPKNKKNNVPLFPLFYIQDIKSTTIANIEQAKANNSPVAPVKYTSPRHLFELFLREAGHMSSKNLGFLLTEQCPVVLMCHSSMFYYICIYIYIYPFLRTDYPQCLY